MPDKRARPEERSQDEAVERYWEAIVSGVPAGPETDTLDPTLAQTVWRVHALGQAPPIDSRFKQRLWEDLMHGNATAIPLRRPAPGFSVNGRANVHVAPRPRSLPTRRSPVPPRQIVATLGLVALLLMMLGGVFLFYQDTRNSAIIPAADGTPTTVATPSEDWPMYRGTPGRTGNLPVTGPTGTPVEAWRFQTQGRIDSTPIVVAGVLYVASEDGNLYALDATTGAVNWTAPLGAGSGSNPAFASGLVYVGDNNNDLHAIDAATGQERWKLTGGGWVDPGPVVDGILYAANADGTFQAVTAEAGEVLWRTPLGQSASRASGYENGQIFVGSGDGRVNALDAKTGALQWSYDLGDGTVGTVAVTGGVVYGSIFGGAANSFVALDAVTGKQLWSFVTPTGADVRSPAIGDDLVYTVSGDGNLYALDAATGTEKFHVATGGPITASPALASGVVYTVSHDFTVYAIDATSGAVLWTYNDGSTTDYGPIVAGGMAYLTTDAGAVIALGSASAATASGSPATGAAEATAPATNANVASTATANPAATGPVQFLYALTGGGGQSFNQPTWMAIDPKGDLWVNNGPTNQFLIFAPDGTYRETWGTPGSGDGQLACSSPEGLNWACDIAFAPDGSFYVLEQGRQRIEKFDANRNFLFGWGGVGMQDGQFQYAFSMTRDHDGNIWVADQGRDNVQVFDGNGKFLFAFGSEGNGNGKFQHNIIGDADADGNVYVGDTDLSVIQKFDHAGKYVATIGESGTGPGQINGSSAPAVDALGNVYVPDLNNARVNVFDSAGAFVTSWGTSGSGDGQFGLPGAVLLDGQGNAYVADVLNNRIEKFRLLPPLAPASGPTGNSAAAATPAAATTGPVQSEWTATGNPNNPLRMPDDIAIDPHGTLWVTDAPGQFQLFDLDGTYLETWGTPGSGDGQFDFVRENGDNYGGVAFASDGSFFVVDTGNLRVQKFDQNRQFVIAWGTAGSGDGQFLEPLSIAIDGQGQLYVLDDLRDDVQVFDGSGIFLRKFRVHESFNMATGQENSSNLIATDGQGNVYITSVLRSSVLKFDPTGKLLAEIGGPGIGDGQFGQPIDVAIAGDGTIYVSDAVLNRVEVFDAQGNFRSQWGQVGQEAGDLSAPTGLAVRGRYIYVAEYSGNRVQKFKLTGQ